MSKMNIRGSEYPIKKIFSDDFVFTIPLYQRAYAWTTEESEELFQDLMRAMDGYEGSIDDLPPYFLGSIVLIKGDEALAEVIDGQQRLTTLTIFIINRCFLIVVSVSTSDLDSAYRIFSVLNSRGLDLSYPDILKAEIISTIPLDEQDEYATKWEEIESLLGSETFEDLFFH